jgi:serine/threonine-protein kinase
MGSDSINPFKDDMTGRLLLGRYRTVRKLATGGMGVVYLARSEGAAGFVKPVVVKLILPYFASKEEYLGMFVREARILSELQNPGIVNVIDFAEEGGCFIMALEYVHGFQLREWLSFLRHKGRLIPTPVAIQIVINVLDSLHHAHNVTDENGNPMQIIHRDISPSNILLDVDGRTKLVDFGIGLMDANSKDSYKTQNQTFKGKFSYAAPELFTEATATVQSDLYACGVTLHEILIGRNEFRAKNPASTIQRVIKHAPSAVKERRTDAHRGLDAVLQKALAKNPQNRFETCLAFSTALRRVHSTSERKALQMLAELVAKDFGVELAEYLGVEPLHSRERAWRSLSSPPLAVAAPGQVAASPIGEELSAGTTIVDNLTPAPESTGAAPMAQIPAPGEPGGVARRAGPHWVLLTAAVALALAISAVGVIWMGLQHRDTEQGGKREFLLVQSPVTAEKGVPPPSDMTGTETEPLIDGAPEIATDEVTSPVESPKRARRGAKKKNAPDPAALTRAFKKRKGRIRSCFERHADDLKGNPKLSILFQINRSGKVEMAELSSQGLSKTDLGKCIMKVARSTGFPPQSMPVSFKIPLTVWRVGEK